MREAAMFPIYASIALFGLYIFFKVKNNSLFFMINFFILFSLSLSIIRLLVSSERFG